MAEYVGKDGDVDGVAGGIKFASWQLATAASLVPTTGFGDSWETNAVAIKSGAFSAAGTLNGTPPVAGDTVTATFQIATGKTYSGTFRVTQVVASSDVNGAAVGIVSGRSHNSISVTG